MSRLRKTATILTVLIGAIAFPAGLIGGYSWLQREFTDGASIRRSARSDAPRAVLWEDPRRLDDLAQIPGEIYEPRLSWDGLTLFFVRGKAGENADIYTARRTPSGWSAPQPLSAINSEQDELGPEPSADGAALYFYSDRPGGLGGYDLWCARRAPDVAADGPVWQTPLNLGPTVNSEFNDYGPAVSHDGKTLYFASNRPQPQDQRQPDPQAWPATVREDWFKRTYDLYQSQLSESGASQAAPIAALNTPSNEGAPCISPNGDFLYFASDRPGGVGGFDLYRARVLHGEIQSAQNLGPSINTPANELDPGLAQLGFALYFSSDRPFANAAAHERHYHVYYSGSREVFSERTPIEWAALWRAYWPLLAYLLLAILTALLLKRLIQDIRDGKLSLLTRCLLASLVLHCLLLMGLGYWRVKAALGDYIGGGGKVKVTLAAIGVSGDLVAQVRGNLTNAASPEIAQVEVQPVHAGVELNAEIRPRYVEAEHAEAAEPTKPMEIAANEAPPAERAPLPRPAALPLNSAELALTAPRAAPPNVTPDPVAPAPPAAEAAPTHAGTVASAALESAMVRMDVKPTASGSSDGALLQAAPAALTGVLDSPFTARAALPSVANQGAPLSAALPLTTPAVERPGAGGDQAAEKPPMVAAASASTDARATLPTGAASDVRVLQVTPEAGQAMGAVDRISQIDAASAAQDAAAHSTASTPSPLNPTATQGFETQMALAIPKAVPASPPNAASAPSTAAPAPVAAAVRGGASHTPTPAAASTLQPIRITPDETRTSPGSGTMSASALAVRDAAPSMSTAPPRPANETQAGGLLPLSLALPAPTTNDNSAAAQKGVKNPEDGLIGGVLHGRVLDAETHGPLAETNIRFDQASGEAVTATTGSDGTYELKIAAPPEQFAVTATHDGYLPDSKNVSRAAFLHGPPQLDFTLKPANESVIAVEEEPEVHHLGNDLFEGAINSQFQRRTEGALLQGEFPVSAAQAPPHIVRAAVSAMVKGIQCPHQVRINGTLLSQRWDHSPRDGSFGEIVLAIEPGLLHAGTNQISIEAVSCNGDLDDFEFVNVQIRLTRRD